MGKYDIFQIPKETKTRYFLGVGETSQAKTPSKDVSKEKIDL